MSEVPAGSEHQHLSTGKSQQQYIHHVQKNSLERKVFFVAPPQDPPTQTPLPSLVLELFLLCYFAFIFLTGGGLDVLLLEGVRGCRGTHIKRDDNIVFMDQGSCISFSKGTFFSIPFLY